MGEYDGHIPGENEYSVVTSLIGNLKAMRRATGEIDGYRVNVTAEYVVREDATGWKLEIRVVNEIGSESWRRHYHSRVDCYAGFEWYLDQHEELEEMEAR